MALPQEAGDDGQRKRFHDVGRRRQAMLDEYGKQPVAYQVACWRQDPGPVDQVLQIQALAAGKRMLCSRNDRVRLVGREWLIQELIRASDLQHRADDDVEMPLQEFLYELPARVDLRAH